MHDSEFYINILTHILAIHVRIYVHIKYLEHYSFSSKNQLLEL